MNSLDNNLAAVKHILQYLPSSWLELTTHRLDIYDESQAKSQFIEQLMALVAANNITRETLESLPTAYDYIRLGHQLSSVLEWILAEINSASGEQSFTAEQMISFSSKTMPILAVLRKNALTHTATRIYYQTSEAPLSDITRLKDIYGYQFEQVQISDTSEIADDFDGMTLLVTQSAFNEPLAKTAAVDVGINIHPQLGSVAIVHNQAIANLVSDIQHVRRRESIAMTPVNTLKVLQAIASGKEAEMNESQSIDLSQIDISPIYASIKQNTGSQLKPLIASSGLSIQYAMMMGLVEDALTSHLNKPVQILLPPNCYGGTNDQARRIADLISNVEIVDLLVDGGKDMVTSLQIALAEAAEQDAVPLVLAEIPTNPRVEVPDMNQLGQVLSAKRKTINGTNAVAPVFMVDQTFCPHVNLLQDSSELSAVKVISFSSGSKFPSGGRCIAGYCAANKTGGYLLAFIEAHLVLSDNAAVAHQLQTLNETMPSMPARIEKAYFNTREFVNFIKATLPKAKINFVSDELAEQGFTPSVFSLDLPTIGNNDNERETYKRELNQKLIDLVIKDEINQCKYCVSYGQLKGTYWTIPATSTQGTTKESDKDYIVRVALSPESDVALLSELFERFCRQENLI